MTRSRRARWFAIFVVTVTGVATFVLGAQAFADQGYSPCQSSVSSSAHDGSWRTGGFRSAGCRAWRHLHPHRLYARTS
jgi:hypothetical protein